MSTFLKIEQDVSTFEVSENLGIFLERLYMYGGGDIFILL